ncbi:monocarboxylate transporter 13-like isoform X1 [Saccostrea echinata]|uniref:monocarboxylate transporter 13-like isoform X1 n=1 Tax=Saccostrea echinata TaxID=191078 RepID=UPI002A822B76|nr:monocarboxylate transporter 13-like isoform X1 [Saccostrea echinata]
MLAQISRSEGGYGWIVVVAVFFIYVIHVGIQGTTGIIHTELVKSTSADLAVIGWIGSLMVGLCMLSAPFVSILTQLVSCRILVIIGNLLISLGFFCAAFTSSVPALILCLGVIPGIGMNLAEFSSTILLKGYFVQKFPLAMGICLSGAGVGMIGFPPFFVYLHATFGVKGAFLLCSAICLNTIVVSLLLRPTKFQLQKKASEKKCSTAELFDFNLFKSHKFVLFVTAHLLFNIGYAVPFTYLPIKGEEEGFSEQSSALFITSLGVGSSVARITFGWFSARFPCVRTRAYLGAVFLATLSTLPVAISSSFPLILVCSVVLGASSGITITEIPTLLMGMLGVDRLPSSLSITALQQGIGALIGIPITEMICRTAGNNNIAFFFTTGVYAMALFLMTLSFYLPERDLPSSSVQTQKFEPKIDVPKPEVFVVDLVILEPEVTGPAAA